jgi:DNA-binding PadR family transcriptional regulator
MPKKMLDNLTESMFYVLLAFRHGEMCGTDISEHIRSLTQGRVILGPGTLYTILGKFEGEGLIEETEVSGRRRTYKITPHGQALFEEELKRLKTCVSDAQREGF